jgi:hypothetical protein
VIFAMTTSNPVPDFGLAPAYIEVLD